MNDKPILAFPAQFFDERATGMDLRDYFAAKAMAALISLPEASGSRNFFAAEAYAYADEMMRCRKHEPIN